MNDETKFKLGREGNKSFEPASPEKDLRDAELREAIEKNRGQIECKIILNHPVGRDYSDRYAGMREDNEDPIPRYFAGGVEMSEEEFEKFKDFASTIPTPPGFFRMAEAHDSVKYPVEGDKTRYERRYYVNYLGKAVYPTAVELEVYDPGSHKMVFRGNPQEYDGGYLKRSKRDRSLPPEIANSETGDKFKCSINGKDYDGKFGYAFYNWADPEVMAQRAILETGREPYSDRFSLMNKAEVTALAEYYKTYGMPETKNFRKFSQFGYSNIAHLAPTTVEFLKDWEANGSKTKLVERMQASNTELEREKDEKTKLLFKELLSEKNGLAFWLVVSNQKIGRMLDAKLKPLPDQTNRFKLGKNWATVTGTEVRVTDNQGMELFMYKLPDGFVLLGNDGQNAILAKVSKEAGIVPTKIIHPSSVKGSLLPPL